MLKTRVVTALIGGTAFLSLLVAGGWPFALMVFLLATIGYLEFARMDGRPLLRIDVALALIGVWGLVAMPLAADSPAWTRGVLTGVVFSLFAVPVLTANRIRVADVAYLFFGACYVGLGFAAFLSARQEGLAWVLSVIACVWATDTGAYFAGRFWGRRKLWPAISPNKTREGFLGGLVCSMAVAAVAQAVGDGFGSLPLALAYGAAVGVIAPLGDLMESALKRAYGVKDSGRLLPGHGGVLDRFDSLLLVFPLIGLLTATFA